MFPSLSVTLTIFFLSVKECQSSVFSDALQMIFFNILKMFYKFCQILKTCLKIVFRIVSVLQNKKHIKNKTLYIKIIFKTYLKILKIC